MGLQGEALRGEAAEPFRAPLELVDAVARPAVEVVMVMPGFTVTLNCCVCAAPRESVAVTPKVNGVATFTLGAVPESVGPVWVSHAGRLENDQVMAPVPPVAVNVCE